MSSGVPPSAGTLNNPFGDPNTMVPSRFQVPPMKSVTGQRSTGTPPVDSTFFSVPLATKPIQRLSGDQNVCAASSVPGNRCGATPPRGRTYSTHGSVPEARAENDNERPSGDTANASGRNHPPSPAATAW